MDLAFGIVLTVLAALSTLLVIGLFVWAAVKDGQENDALQSRIIRRRWPRDAKSR